MHDNAAVLGKRIQRLRITNGLNQADFAEATGIPTGVVSMLENGRQAADETMLKQMAKTLHCDVNYLTRPAADILGTRPWLRAYADASKRAVDRAIADTHTAIEAIEVACVKPLPDSIPTFGGDVNDEDEIEDFAGQVRHAALLEDGDVVGNSIRAAERLGCVVLPLDNELGRHMGMSMRVNAIPVIRVARPHVDQDGDLSPSGDRQRFTVAHEIGHLALHTGLQPPTTADEASRIERQAHRFAGAFLTPAEPLLDDLSALGGRVTLSTLQQLKVRWGVAIKMLVLRMRQLGQIDDNQARSLYKQISARKWNKVEPVPVGHENAVWLSKALTKAYTRNGTQLMHPFELAATHLGLHRAAYLDRWVEWGIQGTQQSPAEVIDLIPRDTRTPRTTQRRPREVTPLRRR